MDTCDRHPSAQAKFVAELKGGETLALCAHCAREYELALIQAGATIHPLGIVAEVRDDWGFKDGSIQSLTAQQAGLW